MRAASAFPLRQTGPASSRVYRRHLAQRHVLVVMKVPARISEQLRQPWPSALRKRPTEMFRLRRVSLWRGFIRSRYALWNHLELGTAFGSFCRARERPLSSQGNAQAIPPKRTSIGAISMSAKYQKRTFDPITLRRAPGTPIALSKRETECAQPSCWDCQAQHVLAGVAAVEGIKPASLNRHGRLWLTIDRNR
jgi:hypothetical protein